MKQRITLVFLTLFLFSCMAIGQTVKFEYDANGNRIRRFLVVEPLGKSSSNFTQMNSKSLQKFNQTQQYESVKTKDESFTEDIKSEDDLVKPVVYPNPTKGVLRVSVQNMPLNARTELKFYDLNGNQLIIIKDIASDVELDISKYSDGIYIMRININDLRFDWKVIKSNR